MSFVSRFGMVAMRGGCHVVRTAKEFTDSLNVDHSAILQADGAAQARLMAANAEAQAIQQIAQMIGSADQTAQYLITQRYIESLRDMTRTQNSKVIFMPVETSSLMASVGSLKEIFAETGEKAEQLPQPPRGPRELNK
ncbi:hypothetical protein [Leptolyngbya sp. 7M]|uniref:hypothetical protein n=1 Tax=Leptolyngbya sp. 7M TaxID=2812896 RepID=UPI001B8D80EF|nr:hypothetical protein [Leptolyngbya sp. 7M]QYO62083.1 hypothetical protein JVX88_18350 [Leptolyngbya sp. 7M]